MDLEREDEALNDKRVVDEIRDHLFRELMRGNDVFDNISCCEAVRRLWIIQCDF